VYSIKYDDIHEVIHGATGENHGSESFGLTIDASKNSFGNITQKWQGNNQV
jgi:hypothetical protein